jgi:hypothetical protein
LGCGRTLLNFRSGQRIRQQSRHLNSDEVFEYGDAEVELTFVVQRGSQGVIVDFRRDGMADVTASMASGVALPLSFRMR